MCAPNLHPCAHVWNEPDVDWNENDPSMTIRGHTDWEQQQFQSLSLKNSNFHRP